ncbi:MAG TPA: metallophosphoesterase [Thermoanaerobaculia bacterium]|jgi:UDP-2,3-diacylglucosamine pyrophosphatase LpxH|nr:metallophosphoesterase [Thermoanaerobaculia bacterium]
MSSRSLIVISDLHISSGPLDDCDPELEEALVSFVSELSRRATAVELVINGDFLDFVQASPWQDSEFESVSGDGIPLCFTEEQSRTKLESICQAHSRIFQALTELLASSSDNRLTIIPGNHDADLFWPSVRESLAARISGGSVRASNQLRFVLERTYRPPEFERIWVEHGHQYDPVNSFFVGGESRWATLSPPIFVDRQGEKRLYECIGTRFLLRFLNGLDHSYPFVDNVKPFSRFLRIFGASALVPGRGPIKAAVAVWSMLRYLGRTAVTAPGELLSLAKDGGQSALATFVKEMSEAERAEFARQLRARGLDLDRPLTLYLRDPERLDHAMEFLADNLQLLDAFADDESAYLSLSGEPGTLKLGKAFLVDETEELIRAADKILKDHSVAAVLMGHTHEVVKDRWKDGYMNSGCWMRYWQLDNSQDPRPWSILRSDSFRLFPYQLNYIEVAGTTGLPKFTTFREKSS